MKTKKASVTVKPLVTEGYDKAASFGKDKTEPTPEKRFATTAHYDAKKFTRGFLAPFLAFAKKKETVTVAALVAEFGGRQFDGHKVNELRIRRYVSYCLNCHNPLLKKVGK